jgi:hypothetical protein
MSYSTLRLCTGGGGFEAIPNPRLHLDLKAIRARLESAAVPVVDARILLIVRMEQELTLSRDGRVLIKSRDPDEANRIFARFRELSALPE